MMSDYEILKESKQAYEILNDLVENCPLLEDIEDTKSLEMIRKINNIKGTMETLTDFYNKAWENLSINGKELETQVKCPRCNRNLVISDLIGYAYLCKNCDENYYYTECEVEESWWK